MWQLFNSCAATLHNSSVQEVNKNSVSTGNSRGDLGRENIITQIGTCPESEDLHTCACKKCHGEPAWTPWSAPEFASYLRHAVSSNSNPVSFILLYPLAQTSWHFGERHDLEGRMSSQKHQVLYHGVSQRPRSENGPNVWKLLPWQKE